MFNLSLIRNHIRLTKTWRYFRTAYTKLTVLREWYVAMWTKNLLKQFSPKSVLDLGCGYGHHAIKIARKHPLITVFCVDHDAKYCESIRHAKKNLSLQNLVVVERKIEDYASDCSYDLVLMITVLQYFNNQVDVLKKVSQMMCDDARLLIYIPTKPQVLIGLQRLMKVKVESNDQFLHSKKEIFNNLKNAKIKIETFKQTYGIFGALSFYIFYLFRFKKPFNFLFPVYLLTIHLISLILMTIDFFSNNKRGNGIIIIAKKE